MHEDILVGRMDAGFKKAKKLWNMLDESGSDKFPEEDEVAFGG